MHCCEKCLNSEYLVSIIRKNNQIGNCHFCDAHNVFVCATISLAPFIRNILTLYSKDNYAEMSVSQSIRNDFNIFSPSVKNPKSLLESILSEERNDFDDLFKGNVAIRKKGSFLSETKRIHSDWENFKEEIKTINRYHILKTINLDRLRYFFCHNSFRKIIKNNAVFYRCRISDEKGFSPDNMGNPPISKATNGRANPDGISYLYVADSLETSLYETRVSLFDYVTIGEFKLKRDLFILDLSGSKPDPIPWSENEEIENYITYIPFIQTLQKELSLPIRKRDSPMDYIPTQYISEFIKSLQYDAVQYKSSLYEGGKCLAIFDYSKLECCRTSVYEISGINLHYRNIVKNIDIC